MEELSGQWRSLVQSVPGNLDVEFRGARPRTPEVKLSPLDHSIMDTMPISCMKVVSDVKLSKARAIGPAAKSPKPNLAKRFTSVIEVIVGSEVWLRVPPRAQKDCGKMLP